MKKQVNNILYPAAKRAGVRVDKRAAQTLVRAAEQIVRKHDINRAVEIKNRHAVQFLRELRERHPDIRQGKLAGYARALNQLPNVAGVAAPPRPLREQAARWIESRANRGMPKSSGLKLRGDATVAQYKSKLSSAVERIRELNPDEKIEQLEDITLHHADTLVAQLALDGQSASSIHAYARALEQLPNVSGHRVMSPPRRMNDPRPHPRERIYSPAEMELVRRELTPRLSLSAQIVEQTGCRAMDLTTIRAARERPCTPRNCRFDQLDPARFAGKEDPKQWVAVTFTAKGGHTGGHVYESRVRRETWDELQKHRLAEPAKFANRKFNEHNPVEKHYAIPTGDALGNAWSAASKKTLKGRPQYQRRTRKHHGIHNLRHTFANREYAEKREAGLDREVARRQVSQQLGHYAPDKVAAYLGPTGK